MVLYTQGGDRGLPFFVGSIAPDQQLKPSLNSLFSRVAVAPCFIITLAYKRTGITFIPAQQP